MGSLSFPRERIRIVLFEGVHPSAARLLQQHGYTRVECVATALSREDLHAALKGAHLAGIRSRTQIDEQALEGADRLIAIGCFCIGTNQVDLVCAARLGVPVFNAPHANTRSVAELVIGLTIMLERGTFEKSNLVQRGAWPKMARGSYEVRGKTIGIVGYGHIGSQVSILAEALGMQVVFHDIAPKLPLGNARALDSLEEVLAIADVLTLHVPQTELTEGMMNAARLGAMRRGAYLINTSRGAVVDQDSLANALRENHIAGAAVDVFPDEPRAPDEALSSPLRGLPNVILTPHVAGSTQEAQEKIAVDVAAKLMSFSDRGSTMGAVNFPELTLLPHPATHRILHIHGNVPGVLQSINKSMADENINVVGQHLETRGQLGYVVLDIEKRASSRLLARLKEIPGTIRTRILFS